MIVDLGCGTYCRGDLGIDVQFDTKNKYDQPWKFDGIMGSKNPNCQHIFADLNDKLPLMDNSFDVVIMRDVIEHLLRPYDTLLEVKRVLKINGILKLTTPNAQVSKADWRDEEHIYSFTEPTITRLVGKVLKVEKVSLLFNDEVIYVEAKKL